MLGDILEHCRERRPLVHCISNYVAINDCANLVLACGASPIMAEDPEEVEEIARICDAVVLNLGMPSSRKLEALLRSGKAANRAERPVIFDPVGVGTSRMRKEAAFDLLRNIKMTVIRGNASEIRTLVKGTRTSRGVDVDASLADDAETLAMCLAAHTGAVVAVSGDTDIVTDGTVCYRVHNGHPMMRCVTGSGCMLSCLVGAYMAADPERPLQTALAAVCAMGLCGEIAHSRLSSLDGSGTYRNYIIDAMYQLRGAQLEKGARYELF